MVCSEEVDDVRKQLAEVADGKRFLLQGGDCAERFVDCNSGLIENKLRILLQMSLVLTWGARMPTLRIGRMAGQYSKPRSSDTETVEGVGTVPSYRGENVNGYKPTDRTPDPNRLLLGYFHSAATLNYVRSLLDSGFSDLHRARGWELDFVKDPAQKARYEQLTKEILSALDFMRVVGGSTLDGAEAVRRASIFASHEGLHLPFEAAMTRLADSAASIWDRKSAAAADTAADVAVGAASSAAAEGTAGAGSAPSASARWYNLGAHFLWIGDRTRALDGAHIEYFRGIANPIGIKVGPSMKRSELVPLIRMLWPNPAEVPGKIVLITRLGAGKVRDLLPTFIRAVQAAGLPVVWTCDPMHGNTTTSSSTGLKTREFANVVSELRDTFEVHRELSSRLGGVHFELTGEDVTECTGGPSCIAEADLPLRYTTHCDPRLNYAQSMELAFLIAQYLRTTRDAADAGKAAVHRAWSTSSLSDKDEAEEAKLADDESASAAPATTASV